MNIQQIIAKVVAGQNLSSDEMSDAMRQIMSGECTPAQIGGLLVGLRCKGETVDEVAAAATVMRELATKVSCNSSDIMDIVGTGGDGTSTFNVSTASALVAAAAGVKIAKHGNRAVSSRSGAADLLEAAGVNIELEADQVAECVDTVGVGFMFAPRHHGAMRHAIGPRRDLGMRTIFNMLGPLTNPAGAPRQLMGVYDRELVEPMAQVLAKLGSERAMVVHAQDGMDEISVSSATYVAELADQQVRTYTISPEDFAIDRVDAAELVVEGAEQSLQLIRSIFDGTRGADIVALNSGAAIYIAGQAESHIDGVSKAREIIESGAAGAKLQDLVDCSARVSAAQ